MATKKIRLPVDANGFPVQGALHPDTPNEIIVSISGASARSTVLPCQVVRVWCDTDCHIAFGDVGILALITSLLLKANTPEYFSMGSDTYIAVIGTSGSLFITPME